MEREFWLERWQSNQLGFHRVDTNPLLVQCWPELGVTQGSAVFVPLCGKSLDMRYLESLGHTVVGVEYSETAIRAYYEEAGEDFQQAEGFYLTRFVGSRTTLYCGDFFDIHTPDILGVRAVYDRGALIALPPESRVKYVDHILRIIPEHAHILLITLDYDQEKVDGPPFAVSAEEVERLYGSRCRVVKVQEFDATDLPPKFEAAGIGSVSEAVYHIVKDQ